MSDTAKVFQSGGSQAVRLPKKYRLIGQTEVQISREGQRIILEPQKKAWSEKFRNLSGSAPDFPYPEEPPALEPGPDSG